MLTQSEFDAMSLDDLRSVQTTLRSLRDNFTHDCVERGMDGISMLRYERQLKIALAMVNKAIGKRFRRRKKPSDAAAPGELAPTLVAEPIPLSKAMSALDAGHVVKYRPRNQNEAWLIHSGGAE